MEVFKDGFNKLKQDEYWEVVRDSKIKILMEDNNYGKLDNMDYGYCITAHKAQGSQWSRVILLNERTYYQTDEDYFKWLYTGLTRAIDKILIIDDF